MTEREGGTGTQDRTSINNYSPQDWRTIGERVKEQLSQTLRANKSANQDVIASLDRVPFDQMLRDVFQNYGSGGGSSST